MSRKSVRLENYRLKTQSNSENRENDQNDQKDDLLINISNEAHESKSKGKKRKVNSTIDDNFDVDNSMANVFNGFVFTIINENLSIPLNDLKHAIVDNGGNYLQNITKSVTHVICNETDLSQLPLSTKVHKAVGMSNVTIVNEEWIMECIATEIIDNNSVNVLKPNNGSVKSFDVALSNGTAANQNIKSIDNSNTVIQPNISRKIAKSDIPVDTACEIAKETHIYIDEKGVIWNATLNQADIGKNANKYYILQLLQSDYHCSDFYCFFHWGRVGKDGQNNLELHKSLEDAKNSFMNKYYDKTLNQFCAKKFKPQPKKYTLIHIDYNNEKTTETKSKQINEQSIKQFECTLEIRVKALIELISSETAFKDELAEIQYDADQLPLGKLSDVTIVEAYKILKKNIR